MNFDIRYHTEYRYAGAVTDNMNTVRVTPAATPTQRLRHFSLTVTPEVRVFSREDYFGTVVHEFEVARPHEILSIDVAAGVDVAAPLPPPDVPWEALAEPSYLQEGAEFLIPHPAARPHPTLDRIIEQAQSATPLATTDRITNIIPEEFEYRKGVTYVGSTVADLLDAGAGVCQDFVHLALGLLRELGVASRYCSGYLFVEKSGARSVEVETHAWLEVLLPTSAGDGVWVAFDPTNRGLVGDRHVKIGHGRWYSDVPPVRGIFRGPAGGELTADVVMTRLDTDGATLPPR